MNIEDDNSHVKFYWEVTASALFAPITLVDFASFLIYFSWFILFIIAGLSSLA